MLAVAGLLLAGSGCGGSGGSGGSGDKAGTADSGVPANRSAAVIPVAGGQPSTPAPQFTAQAPSVPAGGVTLEELHKQGKTEVVP